MDCRNNTTNFIKCDDLKKNPWFAYCKNKILFSIKHNFKNARFPIIIMSDDINKYC